MIKKFFIILLSSYLLIFTVHSISGANELPIVINSSIDKPKITIADHINYTIILSYDPKKIKPPAFSPGTNLSSFEIKDYKIYKQKKKKGKIIQKYEYIITTFTVGEFKIDPLEINYISHSGEEKKITAPEISILVEGIKPSQTDRGDIRDIKSPLYIKRGFLFYSILSFILLFIGGGIGLYFHRKKKTKSSAAPQDTRTPEEIACQELEKISQMDLIKQKKIKLYYILISEIIRKYLEKRFKISVLDRTTYELYQQIRLLNINNKKCRQIRDFLEECDLVKFAKYKPDEKTIQADFLEAKQIIDTNKTVELV
ncbi:hypothetical protein KAI68_06930 [bacterium]|nr:hypothetical protein [bacterium]